MSPPVWDLTIFRPLHFCCTECTSYYLLPGQLPLSPYLSSATGLCEPVFTLRQSALSAFYLPLQLVRKKNKKGKAESTSLYGHQSCRSSPLPRNTSRSQPCSSDDVTKSPNSFIFISSLVDRIANRTLAATARNAFVFK
jgi:hypothetical protein